MENNNKKPIELVFKEDLHQYLLSVGRIDERLPEAPDIETLWAKIGESYLPDAMREFGKYPTVALGWIMFVGMAIAKYWDEDWELYGKVENLYIYLRDRIDFDHMDDYICEKVLLLDENPTKAYRTLWQSVPPVPITHLSIKVWSQVLRLPSGVSSLPCTRCTSWAQPSS